MVITKVKGKLQASILSGMVSSGLDGIRGCPRRVRLGTALLDDRAEGLLGIVAYRLDDAQTLRAALSKEEAVARGEVLGTLDELEGYRGSVARADDLAVNVDDGARLGYGAYVQHGLVPRLDGCRV